MVATRKAETEHAQKYLAAKPKGKALLGRHKHRSEDNIRMDLKEKIGRVWIRFIWLRVGTGTVFYEQENNSWDCINSAIYD